MAEAKAGRCPPRVQVLGAFCPAWLRQQPPKTQAGRRVLPGARAQRAGCGRTRAIRISSKRTSPPRAEAKKDAPSSHNAFLRLEGPIARGVRGGRTAPSAFARPRQTPPCGRRANCPVIGRGAGRHGPSCEGRGFSPRAPAGGAQRAVLSAGGEVFFQCGYSTTPPPSVKSTRSALSCGCSPEDRRPRVLRRRDRAHRLQLRKSKVINPEILIEYVLCFMLYSKCLRTRCE